MRSLFCAAMSAAFFGALAAPAAAQTGPSFDCARAQHPVEHAICADPDLSVLDREIAAVYAAAKAGPDMNKASQAELTARQRSWIASRNTCAQTDRLTECITASYGQRILELKTHYAGAAGSGGQISFGPVGYDCGAPVYWLDAVFINGPVARWVVVSWEDNAVMLVESVAVDGTRYAPAVWGDPFEFSTWHDDATFSLPGQPPLDCIQIKG